MPLVKSGELNMLVQMGTAKVPELPRVPLVMDLAKDDEQRQILELLLAAQGMAILMISSELPEILGMSDRIAVMRGGRVVGILDRSTATQQQVLALALGQEEESLHEATRGVTKEEA